MSDIIIVLSSYNGAGYIGEQIESIRRQTFRNWNLLIRDDGSSDSTVEVVERLASVDSRISLLPDERGNLGPVASFGVLLEQALARQATYVAMSDQDDVWSADKLERQLALLRAHEAANGPGHPTLVHSDLAVVDSDLRPIHPSFLSYQRLAHKGADSLRCLLLQNFVTGCTVVLNRALLRLALPMPLMVMHDWWLAQCAAALGSILFLPEATVLYRQHGENALGSRGAMQLYLDAFRSPAEWWARGGRNLAAASAQVRELGTRLSALSGEVQVDPEMRDLVERTRVALRGGLGPLSRCREVSRLRIRPRSLTVPFFFYLRMLVGLPGVPHSEGHLQ
jgi:glycosyltransferase involved in cell wall biosynthesis